MNGDGIGNDLMYIPSNDSEIQIGSLNNGQFVNNPEMRQAFWNYVEQDSYLKNHKGEYAEAYCARSPWVHRFDLRIAEDFCFKTGKQEHKFQVSLDFLNIGNLIHSTWGISKVSVTSGNSLYNRILKYEGVDADGYATFSTPKSINGNTGMWQSYHALSQCWYASIGIKYIFN
jgi:hypothetical protein